MVHTLLQMLITTHQPKADMALMGLEKNHKVQPV